MRAFNRQMYRGERKEKGIGEKIREILDEGGGGEEWMKRLKRRRKEMEGGTREEVEGGLGGEGETRMRVGMEGIKGDGWRKIVE